MTYFNEELPTMCMLFSQDDNEWVGRILYW